MSDFIYNNFSNEPDNGSDWSSFDSSYSNNTKTRRTNLTLIVVCVFFALLILMTATFGIIIINKLSTASSDKAVVDSFIFSTPQNASTDNSLSQSLPASGASDTEYSSVSEAVYAVKDSVVEIKTSFTVNSQIVSSSAGSGVIIGGFSVNDTPSGYYVVTNAHVIQDDYGNISNQIKVITTDGAEYDVSVVRGIDTYGDLAVLMINTTDSLLCAKFGNSEELVLGQNVIAIGNPLGTLGGTVTTGIISALDREIEIDGNVFNLLQTNAAINPGNSGGALFNMKGEVVGIVNAKSAGEGIEGIGFAIPSNDASAISSDIIEFGYAKGRPFIGVTAAVATNGFTSYVYVHDLEVGINDTVLQKQDIIISMNGESIYDLNDFRSVVSRCKPADTIEVTVKRGNQYIDLQIIVKERTN